MSRSPFLRPFLQCPRGPISRCLGTPWSTSNRSTLTLTGDGLRRSAGDYVESADATNPYISPIFGDLHGLPPMLIRSGSREILLSDALRLASRAADDDVRMTLDVVPGAPHVFQAYAAVLDEGEAALSRAATFLINGRTTDAAK